MKSNFSYQPINCLLEEVSTAFGDNYVKQNPNVLAAIILAGAITHAGNQALSEAALFEVAQHIGDKMDAAAGNVEYSLDRITDAIDRIRQ